MLKSNLLFNDDFKRLAKEHGFRKFGMRYLRIVNDVCQSVSLKRIYGFDCDLEFGVRPLCENHLCGPEHTFALFSLDFTLRELTTGNLERYSKYRTYSGDAESIRNSGEYLYVGLKEIVMPFFESTLNTAKIIGGFTVLCKKALDLRHPSESNYKLWLNWDVVGKSWMPYVALKRHNYDFAKYLLDRKAEHPEMREEYYAEYMHLRDLLYSKEYDKLDEIIAENERVNLRRAQLLFKTKKPVVPIIT